MIHKWEELTVPDFVKAVAEVKGVCVLPLGVLEKHGDHLPIGTDLINVRALAERAIAVEPAILFPPYFFSQIQEAKQWPGTLAVRRDVLFSLLENVLDEIARNGLTKIILLDGHGGNISFLDYFLFSLLEKPRPYTVYLAGVGMYWREAADAPEVRALMKSKEDHHGGELETSITMANCPGVVKMDALSAPTTQLRRLDHLQGARTGMWWYADFPDHYAGDAAHANPHTGEVFMRKATERIAGIIKAVKADTATQALQAEFDARSRDPIAAMKLPPSR